MDSAQSSMFGGMASPTGTLCQKTYRIRLNRRCDNQERKSKKEFCINIPESQDDQITDLRARLAQAEQALAAQHVAHRALEEHAKSLDLANTALVTALATEQAVRQALESRFTILQLEKTALSAKLAETVNFGISERKKNALNRLKITAKNRDLQKTVEDLDIETNPLFNSFINT